MDLKCSLPMNRSIIHKWLIQKWSLVIEFGIMTFILLNKRFFTEGNYMIRMYLYIFCFVLIVFISRVINIDRKKLGLMSANWAIALKQIIIPTILFCGFIVLLYLLRPPLFTFSIRYTSKIQVFQKVLAYVIISVPIQELIFRGYFITRLEQVIKNKYLIILFSSLIFSVVHIPFGILLIDIGAFLLGIYLASNFLRFRNLFVLMLAHGIVGVFFIYFINV